MLLENGKMLELGRFEWMGSGDEVIDAMVFCNLVYRLKICKIVLLIVVLLSCYSIIPLQSMNHLGSQSTKQIYTNLTKGRKFFIVTNFYGVTQNHVLIPTKYIQIHGLI